MRSEHICSSLVCNIGLLAPQQQDLLTLITRCSMHMAECAQQTLPTHVHTHTHTHTLARASTRTRTRKCTRTHTQVHTHAQTRAAPRPSPLPPRTWCSRGLTRSSRSTWCRACARCWGACTSQRGAHVGGPGGAAGAHQRQAPAHLGGGVAPQGVCVWGPGREKRRVAGGGDVMDGRMLMGCAHVLVGTLRLRAFSTCGALAVFAVRFCAPHLFACQDRRP